MRDNLVYVASVIVLSGVLFLVRLVHLVFNKDHENGKRRMQPAKTLIVLGSGGHTTEMLQIVRHLSFYKYSPRIYILAQTDKMSACKIEEIEQKSDNYKVSEIYRSREVGQSYLSSVWSTLLSFRDSLKLVWREMPDLVLCNGPGTCVPIAVAAFLLKLAFIKETKIIFVESFCRVKTLSLSGKILYYLADNIIVQWPHLQLLCNGRHRKMCEVAELTASHVPWDALVENLRDNVPVEMKIQLLPVCNQLRSSCQSNELLARRRIEDSLLRLESCLDQTWEQLNTGYWKNVQLKHRYCYTLCSALKCIFLEIQCGSSDFGVNNEDTTEKRRKFIEIINQVDKAILLGAPLENATDLMTTMAWKLNEYLSTCSASTDEYNEISFDDKPGICKDLLPGLVSIQRLESPSMETFYRDLFKPKTPAVLEGCLNHWKALKSWKNVDYLMKICGNRTVPIEIGSRYTEEDWSQSLVTFADFIRSQFSIITEKVGYLAQHQLFEQIPELKDDFAIPDYCNFSDTEGEASSPDINAWFGPRGTISPLHFDPKNNLLCQVFGRKRVILYRPEESPNLYAYQTRLLSNTAQVDPVKPDYVKWPKFDKCRGSMCYLEPGEMLFIPPGWWHHVESLAPTFSISFWWS